MSSHCAGVMSERGHWLRGRSPRVSFSFFLSLSLSLGAVSKSARNREGGGVGGGWSLQSARVELRGEAMCAISNARPLRVCVETTRRSCLNLPPLILSPSVLPSLALSLSPCQTRPWMLPASRRLPCLGGSSTSPAPLAAVSPVTHPHDPDAPPPPSLAPWRSGSHSPVTRMRCITRGVRPGHSGDTGRGSRTATSSRRRQGRTSRETRRQGRTPCFSTLGALSVSLPY